MSNDIDISSKVIMLCDAVSCTYIFILYIVYLYSADNILVIMILLILAPSFPLIIPVLVYHPFGPGSISAQRNRNCCNILQGIIFRGESNEDVWVDLTDCMTFGMWWFVTTKALYSTARALVIDVEHAVERLWSSSYGKARNLVGSFFHLNR